MSILYKRARIAPEKPMATTASPAPPARRLIGYARVSTEEQATDAQVDELKAAGCQIVHQEHGSGASRAPGRCWPA